ncbi:MAG: DUF1295 domain-containing protein [Thermoplasmata archaeon]|uniref:DUF1295 domain-containing protein n=1 Tax=Candidatus Sysuiplasma superficiale TaxID=2823368 RepID=A0A8J8CF78_9ARCH|nr:isoprenylcysteine carboxylmethyltransferase family protein [Candidatus Sysuiplasma superficiale]MBX8643672.1 DUF1295 domain-containing protein [Candidatus Sysuiplasma superficiale]MCL4346950.1 DUF1295 domain-containing protein [Candidatus Thermoplasmatota archaeon]MCL5437515.1 DUF1295 domain-containing protein [Candidatus Thermoplasmatota archaeon]
MHARDETDLLYNGYFGIPDFIIALTAVSMFASTVRKQPGDPTYWIPFNSLSLLRYAAGALLLAVSLLFSLRRDEVTYYLLSLIGMAVFIGGAVFFFGAKSPLSRIIATGGENGTELSPSGFYRYCRHPLYFGLLLCAAGLATDLASPAGIAVVAAVVLPVLLRSSRSTDIYWRSKTGDVYLSYMNSVNALIPSFRKRWKGSNSQVVEKI